MQNGHGILLWAIVTRRLQQGSAGWFLGEEERENFSGQSYKSRNMISPVQQSFNTIFTKREGEKLETVERGKTGMYSGD